MAELETSTRSELARWLFDNQQRLAASITDAHTGRALERDARRRERSRPGGAEAPETHLEYLTAAIAADAPALFLDYVGWAKVALAGLGFPDGHLEKSLEITRAVLEAELAPPLRSVTSHILDEAVRVLPTLPLVTPSPIQPTNPHAELTFRYVRSLLDGDRRHACRLILDTIEGGVPVRDIYLNVVSPAQHEIGRQERTSRERTLQ